MKKLIFAAASLLLMSTANQALSQNWGGQNPVNSLIKPNESRGYILWSPVPNADYMVNLYEKNSLDNFTLIATKSTENNYARLSNYLSNPNAYYSVSAYNSGTGRLIVTSDPQAMNGLPPETICTKKCNGLTYAYEFNHKEESEYDDNGAHFLSVSPTNDQVDILFLSGKP